MVRENVQKGLLLEHCYKRHPKYITKKCLSMVKVENSHCRQLLTHTQSWKSSNLSSPEAYSHSQPYNQIVDKKKRMKKCMYMCASVCG